METRSREERWGRREWDKYKAGNPRGTQVLSCWMEGSEASPAAALGSLVWFMLPHWLLPLLASPFKF